MKKKFCILSLLCVLILCGCVTTNSISSTESVTTSESETTISFSDNAVTTNIDVENSNTVYFASINDTHGQLVRNEELMGMSEVSGILNFLEEENQEYIKIANGDIFQGSYISRKTYGECFIDVLNEMNFSCMTLGNHEFDWGLDKVLTYFDGDESNGEANFPLICCNLYDSTTNERVEGISAYTIVNYGNTKVGIIGGIGDNLEDDISTESLGNYYFDNLLTNVYNYSYYLRTIEKCDVVVLAVHDYGNQYSSYGNFDYNHRLDAIFFGHTHTFVEGFYAPKKSYIGSMSAERYKELYSVPYVQCNTKNENVGTIKVKVSHDEKAVIKHYSYDDFISSEMSRDEEVDNIVSTKYQRYIDESQATLYTFSSSYVAKNEVANFICDLLNEYYGAYFSFVNTGGVRNDLNHSELTISDIYEIFPFDNYMVECYLTEEKLNEYAERSNFYYGTFCSENKSDTTNLKVVTISYCVTNYTPSLLDYVNSNGYVYHKDTIMRDLIVDILVSKLNN